VVTVESIISLHFEQAPHSAPNPPGHSILILWIILILPLVFLMLPVVLMFLIILFGISRESVCNLVGLVTVTPLLSMAEITSGSSFESNNPQNRNWGTFKSCRV